MAAPAPAPRTPAPDDDPVDGYLALAVRLDRLLPGLADVGALDPALRRRVAAELAASPSDLVRRAGRLLDALDDAGLEPRRRAFLAGQLRAAECTARRLAGQPVPYRTEIRNCFDLAVTAGDPERHRQAHRELAALLPGPGPLSARLARYRTDQRVPADRLGPAVAQLAALLRERTLRQVPLPAGESVAFRIVDDGPWAALHRYRGGLRSQVLVNAGARPRRAQLAELVAHEAYPGHHTERCRKEAGLIGSGWAEHRVLLANSPASVVAEGTAELGLAAVLGPGWGPLVAGALAKVGLGFDGELAERVHGVLSGLARVRLDAALLLHRDRSSTAAVVDHLRRWLLLDEPRARQLLRFLQHPVWRAYTVTYVLGAELIRGWWDRDPGPARLRRLLDEPWTPAAVRAESRS
jgi:hypothetical protein